MSAESADNKLAMTFQSTPPVENGTGNIDEERAEKGNPQTDVNGDANMTGMAITYPPLYDTTDGNNPSARSHLTDFKRRNLLGWLRPNDSNNGDNLLIKMQSVYFFRPRA